MPPISRSNVFGFLVALLLVASGFSRTVHVDVVSGFSRTVDVDVVSGFSRTVDADVVSGFSRTEAASQTDAPAPGHDDGVWQSAAHRVALTESMWQRSRLHVLHAAIVPVTADGTARHRQAAARDADRPHVPASPYSTPLLI